MNQSKWNSQSIHLACIEHVFRIVYFQIASEVNAAILKMEHLESPVPKLVNLMKIIPWAQDELDKKKVRYPHMTDIGSATIEMPK